MGWPRSRGAGMTEHWEVLLGSVSYALPCLEPATSTPIPPIGDH